MKVRAVNVIARPPVQTLPHPHLCLPGQSKALEREVRLHHRGHAATGSLRPARRTRPRPRPRPRHGSIGSGAPSVAVEEVEADVQVCHADRRWQE